MLYIKKAAYLIKIEWCTGKHTFAHGGYFPALATLQLKKTQTKKKTPHKKTPHNTNTICFPQGNPFSCHYLNALEKTFRSKNHFLVWGLSQLTSSLFLCCSCEISCFIFTASVFCRHTFHNSVLCFLSCQWESVSRVSFGAYGKWCSLLLWFISTHLKYSNWKMCCLECSLPQISHFTYCCFSTDILLRDVGLFRPMKDTK